MVVIRDKLNCPNCGAPLSSDRCGYCGTTFYDFASLEDGAPCYMRIRFGNAMMTLKAIPHLESMTMSSDTESAYDAIGNTILQFERNRNLGIDMRFSAIAEGGTLIQMTMK